jgi:uncharacterized protein
MCPHFLYTWPSSLLFILVGGVMGALGGGGALLALPIFLLVLHVPMDLAVPATTAVVGFAALSGAWDAWTGKRLDLSTLWRFALPGMAFSALGAYFSPRISPTLLHWAYFAIVAIAGIRLATKRRNLSDREPEAEPKLRNLAMAGAGTGALMGLFGVGGGFLAMPALVLRGGLAAAAAVPVSLGAMALNASASLAVQIPSGNFRWTLVVPALMAVLAGMEIGGRVSRRLSSRTLERVLGILLLVVSFLLAWKELFS